MKDRFISPVRSTEVPRLRAAKTLLEQGYVVDEIGPGSGWKSLTGYLEAVWLGIVGSVFKKMGGGASPPPPPPMFEESPGPLRPRGLFQISDL
jgi:hypothetical protein